MKKTVVEMGNPTIKVSVEVSEDTVLTQEIDQHAIQAVAKDFGMPAEVATKFLIERVSATLRNASSPEAAEADFQERMMKAVKAGEDWAMASVSVFSRQFLPQVKEIVAKAKEAGQDRATAISVALGVPMEIAKSFIASIELMEHGLTPEQITEVLTAGLRGEDIASIAARYGLTDGEPKKP